MIQYLRKGVFIINIATLILSGIAAMSALLSLKFSYSISKQKIEIKEMLTQSIKLTQTLKTDIKEVRETKIITATQDYAAMVASFTEKMEGKDIMEIIRMSNKQK